MFDHENASSAITLLDIRIDINLNTHVMLRLDVTPILLGLKESISTQKSMQILSDAGIRHRYEDILSLDTNLGQMMLAISGSAEVPQLFVGGESYVGSEQISRYVRA
tara:strand:- start:721 stop:1041 length:321 start_codon:yes stop_codon:yes gene_type:complete